MDRFCITTPIYYATDAPHVGHAYTTLLADILTRAAVAFGKPGSRLMRADLQNAEITEDGNVFFLVGTDEHGAKVAEYAAKAGVDPQVFVDANAAKYKETWQALGVDYSAFIQTTNDRHEAYVAEIAQGMLDRGDIYKGTFQGLYCTGCESLKTKSELSEDGLCLDHLRKPDVVEEENYFFKLSAYRDRVRDHIEAHPEFLLPANRRAEVLAFLKNDLQDLSISRPNVAWGVQRPFDPAHTAYVWIDALFNYVSALHMLGTEAEDAFWPADVQLMGKEIIRFHAVYWPAFLFSAGLPLPRSIVAHGWFTAEGQKMSKTLGNFVRAEELIVAYGLEPARYLLATTMRLDADGDISHDRFRARYASELANGLGNLVNRVVTLSKKYLGDAPWAEPDVTLIPDAAAWHEEGIAAYREVDVFAAAEAAMKLVDRGNKLADELKIWVLAKEDPARFAVAVATIRALIVSAGELLAPIMPESAAKIRSAMETRDSVILFPRLEEKS